jgi:hypothetical protein
LRKLFGDEVREVKMKKKAKKTHFAIKKKGTFCSFVAAPLALHCKDDL